MKDAIELGDLDGTENFGVGSGNANTRTCGLSVFVALEDGVEAGAAEVTDVGKVDDEESGRMVKSPLECGVEMECQGGNSFGVDLADCRYHDRGIAHILTHFQ